MVNLVEWKVSILALRVAIGSAFSIVGLTLLVEMSAFYVLF